jgi:uncharacterized protein YbcI
MMDQTHQQTTELSNYIGKLLRDNFGKGPESVFVSIGFTFVTVYIRNFLTPSEKVLMGQKRETTVQQTRDLVMDTLIPEIKAYIKIVTGMEIREFYYDWGLHNKSGMLVAIGKDESSTEQPIFEDYEGKQRIHEEISNLSEQAQRPPEELYSCQLNPRTLIVIRNGLLVSIEKQLIRQGLQEQLRIAKRSLEKSFLHNNNHFETILGTKVLDIFVDWDFDLDKSVIVFVLNSTR